MKRKVVTNWKIVFDTQEEERRYKNDDTIYVDNVKTEDYDRVLNYSEIEYLDSEISRIIQDMGLWVGDDVWGTDE
jgi:hypothetical protein